MIEILAVGTGANPDLAALDALQNAVREQTRVLVAAKTVVANGRLFEETIITKSAGYVTGYKIRSVTQEGNHYVVRVEATINEDKLVADLKGAGKSVDWTMTAIQMDQQSQKRLDAARQAQDLWTRIKNFKSSPQVRATYPIHVESVEVVKDVKPFHWEYRPEENNEHVGPGYWPQPKDSQAETLCIQFRLDATGEFLAGISESHRGADGTITKCKVVVKLLDAAGNLLHKAESDAHLGTGSTIVEGDKQPHLGFAYIMLPKAPQIIVQTKKVEVAWD